MTPASYPTPHDVGVSLVEFFGIVRYAEALDHVRDFPRMMRALDSAQDAPEAGERCDRYDCEARGKRCGCNGSGRKVAR